MEGACDPVLGLRPFPLAQCGMAGAGTCHLDDGFTCLVPAGHVWVCQRPRRQPSQSRHPAAHSPASPGSSPALTLTRHLSASQLADVAAPCCFERRGPRVTFPFVRPPQVGSPFGGAVFVTVGAACRRGREPSYFLLAAVCK